MLDLINLALAVAALVLSFRALWVAYRVDSRTESYEPD